MLICSKEAFAQCPNAYLCGSRETSTFKEGSECDEFNQAIKVNMKQRTKADQIRAMGNKELAEFINFGSPCNRCSFEGSCINPYDPERCIDGVMKWLDQPVQPTIIIEDDPKVHSGLVTED